MSFLWPHIAHITVFLPVFGIHQKVPKIIMQSHHRVRNATLVIALLLQTLTVTVTDMHQWCIRQLINMWSNPVSLSAVRYHVAEIGYNKQGYSQGVNSLFLVWNVLQPVLTYP